MNWSYPEYYSHPVLIRLEFRREICDRQKRDDTYLSLVYGLLVEGGYNSTFQGGSANAAEGGKYKDSIHCLLGHGAYELATMDKLIAHILMKKK
eukprot:scaffold9389_cov63-Attheya_sp.AAC.1